MFKFGKARQVNHDKVIEGLLTAKGLLDFTENIADRIGNEAAQVTSSSSTLKPFGRMMSTSRTERGSRVGTSWGPAVPVEFGTFSTPAHRILTTAAEHHGRTTP